MVTSPLSLPVRGRRLLLTSAATAAGALLGAQVLVIGTLVTVDRVKERDRTVRAAEAILAPLGPLL